MDILERYIAAVQRELPEQKRDDIGRELKANILDQIEALELQQGSISTDDVAQLLLKMGHPRSVARQFCPPKPLIAAGLMPLYFHTLYMVFGVLFLLSVVEVSLRWIGGSDMSLLLFIKALASDFLNSAYFAFTAITIGFAVIGRDQKTATPCQWHPEKLPPAGKNVQHISLQNIFSDLATLLFLVLLIWYPLWQPDSASKSLFSAEALTMLTWFTPVIVIAIAHCLWQLRTRFWSRNMLMLNIAISTAFLLAAIYLLQLPAVIDVPSQAWHSTAGVAIIEMSASVTLIVIAVISGYEIIRDSRRLLRQ